MLDLIDGELPNTFEVDPKDPSIEVFVQRLATKAEKLNAAVLTANQVGESKRVAWIKTSGESRIKGIFCNLDVSPQEDEPLYYKAVKVYHTKNKILVPVYKTLQIEAVRPHGKKFETTSTDLHANLTWFTAEVLLNSAAKYVPVDYGTIRNETPRIGRNESCPCGSGKKFKKCCL